MDCTVLSNWHSAPRGEPFPLATASPIANGLEVEVYTDREDFRFLMVMPSKPLRFRGVFKDRQGYQIVFQAERYFYWRLLTSLEYRIIQFWWNQLPERRVFEDELLGKIYSFFKRSREDGYLIMITLQTRHRRFVMLTENQCHAFYRNDWRVVDNPQIIAQLLADGKYFWVHREQHFPEGGPMKRKTFLTYINPTARRAS